MLLKQIFSCIEVPLHSIINRSLLEGCFPSSMKIVEVIPLFKNKDRKLCTNYRPISLLLTISKILEKIVYSRTYDFLNNTHQIFDSQYGFQKKHSCEHAIQELIGNILEGYENDKSTIAVFLDLSKAFDTISHRVLFEKLSLYGIQGSCLDWFKAIYLEEE